MRSTRYFRQTSSRIARAMVTLAAACAFAFGQQPLTTIQDTLFKADGTRFSGSVTIHWKTFDAVNIGTIVQQTRTVQVVNGNLQVQLAANATAQAPANVYKVNYQADGREQFSETWTVPATTRALHVSDVRIGSLTGGGAPGGTGGAPGGTGGTGGIGNQTPILEADVVGLLSDLEQRPVKGSGFGAGRVAIVNDMGEVDTAVGDVADCVRVDGTSGPCGSPAPVFMDAETPGGIVDGSNPTFTLVGTPMPLSLLLFRNGMYMKAGLDYTLSASTIQFVTGAVPQPMDTVVASYRADPSASGNIGQIQLGGGSVLSASQTQVVCSASGATTQEISYASLGRCNIPAAALRLGDRIEIRFTLAHTGNSSGYDVQVKFGSTAILTRHAAVQDAAFVGRAEAGVASDGVQVSAESFGTVLALLPSITNVAAQDGTVKIDFLAQLAKAGLDAVTLKNYTVLRYPAN